MRSIGLFQDFFERMGCQDCDDTTKSLDGSKDKKSEWIEAKFYDHAGFLVEAMIESFPMSILQMIAIVDLQEPNWMNIISILLSMISVGTKSIFFSYSMNNYVFTFHWICAFVDCFGIFTSIAWSFYFTDYYSNVSVTNMTNIDLILYLSSIIYIYKVLFVTLPFAFWYFIFATCAHDHGIRYFYGTLYDKIDLCLIMGLLQ